jgi:hypothetical protein
MFPPEVITMTPIKWKLRQSGSTIWTLHTFVSTGKGGFTVVGRVIVPNYPGAIILLLNTEGKKKIYLEYKGSLKVSLCIIMPCD